MANTATLVDDNKKNLWAGGVSPMKASYGKIMMWFFLLSDAFTFSALSWLIIMSIDAHWYSTMFSVYNFAISFVTALSVMMLILQYLKSKGYMRCVNVLGGIDALAALIDRDIRRY